MINEHSGLRERYIKRAYSSDADDIVEDFYIPVLKESVEYDRLAGFFSSSSLAVAARGILGLIKNGGKIRLVVSPILNKEDIEALKKTTAEPENFIEESMLRELEIIEEKFVKDHVFALSWMVANGKAEIKVALVYEENGTPLDAEYIQRLGLFHQKVGILKDNCGDIISFSGSVNETVGGWLGNIEEFKVFRSWDQSENEYVKSDIEKFDRYWKNRSKNVHVMDVPDAIKRKLISLAPPDIDDLDLLKSKKVGKPGIPLHHYQEDAINAWERNNMRGIFEMATGTGKTYTALGCVRRTASLHRRLVTVITAPLHHLLKQWDREIGKAGLSYDKLVFASSENSNWRDRVTDALNDVFLGNLKSVLILATHDTFYTEDFRRVIIENKRDTSTLLVADEVHGLGAAKRKLGLIDEYEFRLGLSATPRRWDILETEYIYEYFGDIVFEFELSDAINTINPATGTTYLTPYRYIPEFISLSEEEVYDYVEKTKSIISMMAGAKDSEEKNSILELLLFRRADIIKDASGKYNALENILMKIGDHLEWTIVYCSPQQIDEVVRIIGRKKILTHRFTMHEGTTPSKKYGGISEREYLLKAFEERKYQALVAMKCLDEGVDIPPARTAILMASSSSPREYIQRIGRVIRRYPGKTEATIYDIIALPDSKSMPPEMLSIERSIVKKELDRYEEIAKIAINNAEALKIIYAIRRRYFQ